MQLGQLGPGNYCATIERHSEGQWLALGQRSASLQLVSDVNSLSQSAADDYFWYSTSEETVQ